MMLPMGLSILVGATSAYICCCLVSLPSPGACSSSCQVRDAIQPSNPLSSSSPPAFSLSQHHGLFPMNQLFVSYKLLIYSTIHIPFVFIFNIQK